MSQISVRVTDSLKRRWVRYCKHLESLNNSRIFPASILIQLMENAIAKHEEKHPEIAHLPLDTTKQRRGRPFASEGKQKNDGKQ